MSANSSRPPNASDIRELLVGRADPLDRLRGVYDEAVAGAARTVFVSGESGIGKSCLVEEFLAGLGDRPIILRGRCFERESVPYKAIDDLVDAMAETLRLRGADRIRDVLPEDFSAAALLFPVLGRLLRDSVPLPEADLGNQQELQRRAFASLHGLLSRLAEERPVVVFVDDLQWGDLASVPFLSELMSPSPRAVLFVATYRSENRDSSPVLRRLLDVGVHALHRFDEMALGPLSNDDLLSLAARSLGEDGDVGSLRKVVEEAQGRPYFLQELLRWSRSDRDHAGAVGLDDVIRARSMRLAEPARSLLHVLVVAGNPITWRMAEAVAGVGSSRAKAASELRSGRFVRATGDGPLDRVQTYHDRVREAVASSLDDTVTAAIHRALADAFESAEVAEGIDRFALARHRFLGRDEGTLSAAFQASVTAGREAVAAYADDQAFVFFDQALTVAAETNRPFDARLNREFGGVCARTGRMERATRHLRRALEGTEDPTARAGIRLALARVDLGQLESEASVVETGLGLAELGLAPPSASLGSVLTSLGALVRGLIVRRFGRVEGDPSRRSFLRAVVDLNTHLGLAAYFRMERVVLVESLLRAMAPAARLGPTRQLAEWYALGSTVLAILRKDRIAIGFKDRAMETARRVGNPASEARARQYGAHAMHFLGKTVLAEKAMVQCMEERGRLLENQDFFTAAADLAWNTLLRGKPDVGWRWIEASLRQAALDREENPLTQGHTFRCYAGPLLALRGFPEQGLKHLRSFEAFIEATPNDRWRWAQWLAHLTLFHLETGAADDLLETAIARFQSFRLSPRALPLQITHFYVAKLRFRIRQYVSARANEKRARRSYVTVARRELSKAGRGHPTLRAHLAACDSRVAWADGRPKKSEEAALLASRLAEETDNAWIRWEVCLLRSRYAPAEASRYLEEAHEIAESRGWRPGRERTPGIGLPEAKDANDNGR